MSETKTVPLDQGIDLNLPVLDINGNPIERMKEEIDGGAFPLMRIGDICVNALMSTPQDDNADGIQKLKRFNLARKIKGSFEDEDYPTLRLNSKNKKMIEELVEKVYPTLTYARLYEALEGNTEEEEGTD
jgi:hypothetical protein